MKQWLHTDHRPWPVPNIPWIMKQTWEDLLFAHWEVDAALLRKLIPTELTLDTFQGKAWIAVVPFRMSGIRLRGCPPIPGTTTFPELNVRTYVTYQDKPGVYFFSLDADNAIAVAMARLFFHLPYYKASISITSNTPHTFTYRSERTHKGARRALFDGSYSPTSQVFQAKAGSLEAWLVERYCLYTVYSGKIYRGDIHHEPWGLQLAEASIVTNTMVEEQGIFLSETAPLLYFSKKLDVLIWPLQLC